MLPDVKDSDGVELAGLSVLAEKRASCMLLLSS